MIVAAAAAQDPGGGLDPAQSGSGPPQTRPFFDAAARPREYAGPGREDPEPDGLREILLGWFGPADPDHDLGSDLWLAASLAVETANREGGYKGLPFRLAHAWSENPWGNGAGEIARIVYRDRVWAILGSIDGAATHVAEQIAAKARITLLSPASTDKTANMANVAWIFSCMPSDDRHAPLIGRAVLEAAGRSSYVMVSATDHDSRAATAEILAFLSRLGSGPLRHLEFKPGAIDAAELAATVAALRPAAALIVAGAMDSAHLVVGLRSAGFEGRILGGPSMGRRIFAERAGRAAEGAVFPFLCGPGFSSTPFAADFASRSGHEPDCAAAQAHDATRMLVAAVREAGLNRARIRDAVQALSPWSGAAGLIEWDNLGQNVRSVRLGTIQGGRAVPLPGGPALSRAP